MNALVNTAFKTTLPDKLTGARPAMQFSPQVIEVAPGDTVVWTNKDPFPHMATAQDRSFDSGEIAPKRSWKLKARKKGVFSYVCTLHPTMKGNLVIK